MHKSNSKKAFNLSVSPLWQTSSQNLMGIEVNEEILQALKGIKLGGKLFIKFLSEDRRKNDNSPHAYLEFISPEEVSTYKSSRPSSTGGL